MIDGEGYVLESVAVDKKLALPVLHGLEFTDYALGKKLVIKNVKSFESGIKLLEAIKENDKTGETKILGIADAIDVSDPLNVKLSLDSRISVNLGDLQDLN